MHMLMLPHLLPLLLLYPAIKNNFYITPTGVVEEPFALVGPDAP